MEKLPGDCLGGCMGMWGMSKRKTMLVRGAVTQFNVLSQNTEARLDVYDLALEATVAWDKECLC